MTYWLGIDSPEVWEEAKKKFSADKPAPFGFPLGRRKSVQEIQIGDYIVNYMTGRSRFFAVWEVTKGYTYNSDNKLAGNTYSECVWVRPVVIVPPVDGIENPGVVVQRSAIRLRDEIGEDILNALRDRAAGKAVEDDLQEIHQRDRVTERQQYIAARLGQGEFRTQLLQRWGNRCAVTGNPVRDAIRASHAKPWKMSNDQERLDPENGLPLLATLDALFDVGLISFDETGGMLVSPKLTKRQQAELDQLGVSKTQRLRRPLTEKEHGFLAYHRDHRFKT